MAEPTIVPRSAHTHLAPRHRSRRPQSPLSAPRAPLRRVSGRRERARSAARAAGRRTSTSGRRRTRTRSRSSFATAGSSAGASGSRTSSSARKTIEVATFRRQVDRPRSRRGGDRRSARGRRRRRWTTASRRRRRTTPRATPASAQPRSERSADPARQHLRHARRGRVPPRLHGQRAVLRHRHVLDHRLRRRARGPRRAADPLHRRSRRAVPRRSGPHAARGGARGAARVHHRSSRSSTPSQSTATRSRAARRRGCSRSTTRSCDRGTPRKRSGSCARRSC